MCQIYNVGPTTQRHFENRLNLNNTSVSKLGCNIKCMYRGNTGQRFILVAANEVINYSVTISLYTHGSWRNTYKFGIFADMTP